MEPASATRDYARIGFVIPFALALAADAVGLYMTWHDTTGYQGLFFIFLMIVGVPVTLLWMIVGSIVVRTSAPAGSARRFAIGAGVALGAMLIIFSASCFLTYV